MENINLEKHFEEVTGLNFTNFYKEHKPKLIWFLSHYTRSIDDSCDFCDEAFIQALKKIDTYNKEKSQVHTWIYKIAENLVRKNYKDRMRMQTISIDQSIVSDEKVKLSDFLKQYDSQEDLYYEKVNQKKAEIVREVIEKLPEKYRTVLVMRELDGMAYKEISDSLNVNLSTIKSQISKGRQLVIKKVQSRFNLIDENGI